MMKNTKTTFVAFVMAIAFLGSLAAYLLGKIDGSELGISAGYISGAGATLIGLFAADSKKSN